MKLSTSSVLKCTWHKNAKNRQTSWQDRGGKTLRVEFFRCILGKKKCLHDQILIKIHTTIRSKRTHISNKCFVIKGRIIINVGCMWEYTCVCVLSLVSRQNFWTKAAVAVTKTLLGSLFSRSLSVYLKKCRMWIEHGIN